MPIVEGKYVNPQFQNLGPPALSAGNLNDLADTVEALDAVGAQANVIETIEVNGSALTPENKTVDITVPTATSELDNDSDFQTGNEVGQTVQSALSPIEAKIPVAASASNQLADKNYVAQQISTNAAFFRGSFPTKAALIAVQWQTADPNAPNYVTNNDYAVVEDDESHDDECWRYIYVSGTGWQAQYRINESPLTSDNGVVITDGTNVGLKDKFYNYLVRETFEIPELTLTMNGVGGAKEIGTSLTISTIDHSETNTGNIADGTLKFYRGNTAVQAITPSASTATVTLDEAITEAGTSAGSVSYKLQCTDTLTPGNTRSSNTITATWYRYVYSQVGDPNTPPMSASAAGCVKQANLATFAANGADFTYAVGNCIWLLTTNQSAKIQTNVLGQWVDVTYYGGESVTFTQENNATATYYAYRTDTFIGAGTAKYRITNP